MPSERTMICILIQEEKTNLVAVNHGRLGYNMCLKEIKGTLFRILSPLSLFHIIFHLQVWWSVEESGYPKVYHLFRTTIFSQLLRLSNLMFQKLSKSSYGLTPIGMMLCNLGLHYYINWLMLENMAQQKFIFCAHSYTPSLMYSTIFFWSNSKFPGLLVEVNL